MFTVLVFLIAIVLANLSAAHFGPWATPINAFVLIGLNISLRDKLHETWHGKHLPLKMLGLIVAGSGVTLLINFGAWRICLASVIAFAVSITVDAVIYELMFKHKKIVKMNVSNIGSSIADSILFPTIAFGGFMPLITLGQIVAKIGGGALWAWILTRKCGEFRE